jgi:hypothetical protein
MSSVYETIGGVCDENTYAIRYLLSACESKRASVVVVDEGVEVTADEGAMEVDLGF